MDKILVDTDVLIDYSKGSSGLLQKLIELQENRKLELFINPVIAAEFFTDQNLAVKSKFDQAEKFLGLFGMININREIGILAGSLSRKKAVSFLGDSLIAATCLQKKLKLATRNKKHFNSVKNLNFYN